MSISGPEVRIIRHNDTFFVGQHAKTCSILIMFCLIAIQHVFTCHTSKKGQNVSVGMCVCFLDAVHSMVVERESGPFEQGRACHLLRVTRFRLLHGMADNV